MTLAIRSLFPKTVFELMGKDENSATYALGWTLERSPCLAAILAERLAGQAVDVNDIRVALQRRGDDRGFSDMEIRCGVELQAILEAKHGFVLPSIEQLRRYRPRLDIEPAARQILVSTSAVAQSIATRRLCVQQPSA